MCVCVIHNKYTFIHVAQKLLVLIDLLLVFYYSCCWLLCVFILTALCKLSMSAQTFSPGWKKAYFISVSLRQRWCFQISFLSPTRTGWLWQETWPLQIFKSCIVDCVCVCLSYSSACGAPRHLRTWKAARIPNRLLMMDVWTDIWTKTWTEWFRTVNVDVLNVAIIFTFTSDHERCPIIMTNSTTPKRFNIKHWFMSYPLFLFHFLFSVF